MIDEANKFGRSLGFQKIDPIRIKFADDQVTSENPFRNPRSNLNIEEINNKRESIRTLGLLKPPIVRPLIDDPDYDYQMIAGSLRLRCILKLISDNSICYDPETQEWYSAKELYQTISCNVRECDELTAIQISVAENLEHTQVPELDLMEYCKELVSLKDSNNNDKYSKKEIAKLCNRSESWISLTLKLDNLSPAYKKLMYDGRMSRTAALTVVGGVNKKYYDDVIKKCEETVQNEAIAEEEEALIDEQDALLQLEEAEIDAIISEQAKDEESLSLAKKKIKSAQKKFSAASEKKQTAKKKKEEGIITAETVSKVISSMPSEVKKGKAKALTQKLMRKLKKSFIESIKKRENLNGEALAVKSCMELVDIFLGEKPIPEDIFSLIDQQKVKIEEEQKEVVSREV